MEHLVLSSVPNSFICWQMLFMVICLRCRLLWSFQFSVLEIFPFLCIMRLHVVSWNVNGLHMTGVHGPRKLLMRQDLHKHVVGEIDVLLVQEHKLSFAHAHSSGKLLTGASRTFWDPATGNMFRSGGVCISIAQRWMNHIQGHGTIVFGRAIWVSVIVEDRLLGFMSVYAPTEARARAVFWHDIFSALPQVDSWIIGGDFNNIENASDVRAVSSPLHHFDRIL